jgi:hypothetical protein
MTTTWRSRLLVTFFSGLGFSGILLTGCGTNNPVVSAPITFTMHGSVHAGGQPVTGSSVLLYIAGSSGNAGASTPFIASGATAQTSTATTDSKGAFTIAGDYSCPSSNAQVYLVATGGNPGLVSGTNNTALTLVDALGSCSSILSSSPTPNVNEATTAAAAWALAPFALSSTALGSSSTNAAGLANAFLNAQLLADPITGTSPGSSLLSNTAIENTKLNTLADALANCAHSDGTSACAALFAAATAVGGSTPKDVFTAALNIVRNPGQNVAAVFAVAKGTAVFSPVLATAPNDWTMSLTVSGGGLKLPTALDVDVNGNVWSVGEAGPLVAFSPQGKVLSGASGFGSGYLKEVFGLTIDSSGNVWVADYQYPSRGLGGVVAFQGLTGSSPGTEIAAFTDNSLNNPDWIAADTNGTVFAANFNSSSASSYTTAGLVTPGIGASYGYAFPEALAVDSTHGVWLSDGDYTISHYSATGSLLGHPTCCYGSYGLATDKFNNVWVANYFNNTFSEVSNSNAVSINMANGGGVNTPAAVNIDGAQNVWFTNYQMGTISEIAGNGGTVLAGTNTPLAAGTPISPTVGAKVTTGGYGLDAALSLPIGIVPDSSGDVWVANRALNNLVMFFGLAAPTVTPVRPTPTAP